MVNKNSSDLDVLEISNKIFINYNSVLTSYFIISGSVLCFKEFVIYNKLKKILVGLNTNIIRFID